MSPDINLAQRVTRLETVQEVHEEEISEHGTQLKHVDGKLSDLVTEVGKIRYALYFLGVSVAANVPINKAIGAMLSLLGVKL